MITDGHISENFKWLNQPGFLVEDGVLTLRTSPDTDYWQRTHYGFQRDNAHALVREISTDFIMTVRTRFHHHSQYDQCGLLVRIDAENWIKCSVEYETASHSRLGSVVTNLGYSDWATVDITEPVNSMWYRIRRTGADYTIEYSRGGTNYHQQRIAHIHVSAHTVYAGIYACSPSQGSFEANFSDFSLTVR